MKLFVTFVSEALCSVAVDNLVFSPPGILTTEEHFHVLECMIQCSPFKRTGRCVSSPDEKRILHCNCAV